jgi:hypothetical protein
VKNLPEWFPGTGFHAVARKCRALLKKMRQEPFNSVKEQMVREVLIFLWLYAQSVLPQADGTAGPSITRTLLEASTSESDEELISDVAAMIYVGEGVR